MKRVLVILVVIAALLGLGVVGGLHYASRTVRERVLHALGPESEMQEAKVGVHEVLLAGFEGPVRGLLIIIAGLGGAFGSAAGNAGA